MRLPTPVGVWCGADVIVPPGLQVDCGGAGIPEEFEGKPDKVADAFTGVPGPGVSGIEIQRRGAGGWRYGKHAGAGREAEGRGPS